MIELILNNLGGSIAAIFAAIAGLFMLKSKLQGHKIENLKEKNFKHEKLSVIQKEVKQAEIKAEAEEDAKIQDFDDTYWDDNI